MQANHPENVHAALIDVSRYATAIEQGALTVTDAEAGKTIARLVAEQNGYAVCFGMNQVLARHGLSLPADAETARLCLEALFHAALAHIDVSKFSYTPHPYTHVGKMDVDGYNKNTGHAPNPNTKPREFVTTKCIHFDGCTPFIANIYGPNSNIKGGYPIISDTRAYCRDRGVDPRVLVENIPENYNVVVRKEHYDAILADYSVGFDIDLEGDVVMIMLLNEVTGGVAHAATPPRKIDESKPALRPIRHIEFQHHNPDHYQAWYDHYGLELKEAGNIGAAAGKIILNYHGTQHGDFSTLVRVDNQARPTPTQRQP